MRSTTANKQTEKNNKKNNKNKNSLMCRSVQQPNARAQTHTHTHTHRHRTAHTGAYRLKRPPLEGSGARKLCPVRTAAPHWRCGVQQSCDVGDAASSPSAGVACDGGDDSCPAHPAASRGVSCAGSRGGCGTDAKSGASCGGGGLARLGDGASHPAPASFDDACVKNKQRKRGGGKFFFFFCQATCVCMYVCVCSTLPLSVCLSVCLSVHTYKLLIVSMLGRIRSQGSS